VITHLSVSQLDMFQRCGEQYRRRYLEEEVIPPGIAARVGAGVHKAAEVNYRAKMQTGEDMPLDAVQDAAAGAYVKALQDGVFFSPEEAPRAKAAMGEGKDSAVALATVFRRDLAPGIKPALIEEKITIDLPGVPLPVFTVLDLYTADRTLHDLKTSGKKWPEGKAHTSHQPTAYREAVKAATGEYPNTLCFDVLVNTKTPALQTLATERNQGDTVALANHFRMMLAAISAGIFLPAEPGAWICSPKWCGYWFTCNYISLHRRNARGLAA
jgi:hypothetical protein